ncbi:MAG TPA: ABC transporter permease [Candidatus Elarobacter sp.]|jgi:ABC-2 type transport system permease protein|nr:ABC transporter permease [Candidatus Elarobacter sp.]
MTATTSLPQASPWSRVGAIFRRDAIVALSYPGNFALSWLSIVIQVVVAWYISRLIPNSPKFSATGEVAASYFQYIAINTAFVRFQTAALNSFAESIRDAQLTGTLEIVLSTPTRLNTLVLSSAVWSMTYTVLQTVVFLAIAAAFGLDLRHVDALTALVFLILTVTSVAPLGVLAAALSMVIKKTGPVEFLSTASASLFGGVYLPLRLLPGWLQAIGWTLPITHALNGFRAAASGVPLAQVAGDAIWLLVASAILMPLSLWLFAKSVDKARVDGTLSMY